MADKIQFFMQGNLIGSFSAVEQDIPVMDVAAIFQKDPQVLIAHPDSGVETFADLAKLPTIFMGKDLFTTGFQWMKKAYPGFKDEQIKPYTFNPAPFLADKMSAQQGYITSEPYAIEEQGGFKPKLFLLADAGFNTHGDDDRSQGEVCRDQPRHRPALRRCLDHRLVQLPLRRQHGRQRPDQEGQSRDDRRSARLLDPKDEGVRAGQLREPPRTVASAACRSIR